MQWLQAADTGSCAPCDAEVKLKEHVENKHSKNAFSECFPGWTAS